MNKIYQGITVIFILLSALLDADAQAGKINGVVKDTTSYPRVENAVVALIGSTDSVLRCFTHSHKDGTFSLNHIVNGNYILVVSHPDFGDYAEEISISDSVSSIFREIYLVQKSILINEVIIQRQRDVKISGDTTEFNAKNYKLLENASAEDLLKLLPGIKVDKDGKITAYGEPVNKVYVDGEEFFSDDPTVATKNLKAEMIDKVQVYDKKSDQETLTGIDDGDKNNVINFKLKEEYKKGFFGKIKAGAGLPGTLDNAAMINRFNNKRKLTAYVTQSNTGNNQLEWNDRKNYGSAPEYSIEDDGFYYTYYSSDDDILSGDEGISNSVNGGLNYNDKLINQKLGINAGYSLSSGNRKITKTTNTRQGINDSTYFSNQNETYNASLLSHQPSVRLVFDADSNNKINYSIKASSKNIKLKGAYYSEMLNSEKALVNNSTRSIDQDQNNSSLNQDFLLAHKFKKKGRTLSVSATLNLTNNSNLKYSNTRQEYFNSGLLSRSDTLDQKNNNSLINQKTIIKAAYTEMLGKNWFLEIHYKPSFSSNKSVIASTVKDFTGEYSNKVDSLSNSFVFNTSNHEGGVTVRYNQKKINLSLTLNDENGTLSREDLINSTNNSTYKYNAINPSVQLRYSFKNNASMNLNYSGNNVQPQISQMQPIKDYTNPLNINTGNPNLKPEYTHRVNAFIHKFSIEHNKYYYINLGYTNNQKPFTQKSTFSKEGVTRYYTINGDPTTSLFMWAETGRNILKDLLRASLDYSLSSFNSNSIINETKNTSRNIDNRVGVSLSYAKEKVMNVSIGYHFSYAANTNKSTITTQTNILSQSISAEGKLIFLKHFYLEADYAFSKNKSSSTSTNPYQTNILNAGAGYKFLNNKAIFEITGNNLFNQNNGFNLYQSASSVVRSQHNVIGRYIMFSFVYNFSDKSTHKNTNDEDDDF